MHWRYPIGSQKTAQTAMTDLSLYFLPDQEAVLLPLDQLRPTRARPEGIENAAKRMDEAAQGLRDRRPPITVRQRADGAYDIVDGNSTYAVAKARGWTHLPCRVITQDGQSGQSG